MRSRKKKGFNVRIAAQLVACEKTTDKLRQTIHNYEQGRLETITKCGNESAKLTLKNVQLAQQNASLINEINKALRANMKLKHTNNKLQSTNDNLQSVNGELLSTVNGSNHAEVALKQLVEKRLVSADYLEKVSCFREKFLQAREHVAVVSAKITDAEECMADLKLA